MNIVFYTLDQKLKSLLDKLTIKKIFHFDSTNSLIEFTKECSEESPILLFLDYDQDDKEAESLNTKLLTSHYITRLIVSSKISLKKWKSHQLSDSAADGYIRGPLTLDIINNILNDFEVVTHVKDKDIKEEGDDLGNVDLTFIGIKRDDLLNQLEEVESEDRDLDLEINSDNDSGPLEMKVSSVVRETLEDHNIQSHDGNGFEGEENNLIQAKFDDVFKIDDAPKEDENFTASTHLNLPEHHVSKEKTEASEVNIDFKRDLTESNIIEGPDSIIDSTSEFTSDSNSLELNLDFEASSLDIELKNATSEENIQENNDIEQNSDQQNSIELSEESLGEMPGLELTNSSEESQIEDQEDESLLEFSHKSPDKDSSEETKDIEMEVKPDQEESGFDPFSVEDEKEDISDDATLCFNLPEESEGEGSASGFDPFLDDESSEEIVNNERDLQAEIESEEGVELEVEMTPESEPESEQGIELDVVSGPDFDPGVELEVIPESETEIKNDTEELKIEAKTEMDATAKINLESILETKDDTEGPIGELDSTSEIEVENDEEDDATLLTEIADLSSEIEKIQEQEQEDENFDTFEEDTSATVVISDTSIENHELIEDNEVAEDNEIIEGDESAEIQEVGTSFQAKEENKDVEDELAFENEDETEDRTQIHMTRSIPGIAIEPIEPIEPIASEELIFDASDVDEDIDKTLSTREFRPEKTDSLEATSIEEKEAVPQRIVSYSQVDEDKLLTLQTTIRELREEREQLIERNIGLEDDLYHLKRQDLGYKSKNEELEIEINILKKKHTKTLEEKNYKMGLLEEKKLIWEEKSKNYQDEYERLESKLRVDFNKVRQKERELEGQLELLTMDTEQQVQSRDNKILELKQKIDALEFNMENSSIKEQQHKNDKVRVEERLDRVMRTLRGSIELLEDDLIVDEDFVDKDSNL